jgi:hypothetical protein
MCVKFLRESGAQRQILKIHVNIIRLAVLSRRRVTRSPAAGALAAFCSHYIRRRARASTMRMLTFSQSTVAAGGKKERIARAADESRRLRSSSSEIIVFRGWCVLRGRECARAFNTPASSGDTLFEKFAPTTTSSKKNVIRLFFLLADERPGRIYREKVNDERSFASLHRTRSYFFERPSPSPFSCPDLRETLSLLGLF